MPAGTYRLNGELGELPVDGQVTITGAGAGQTRIESAGNTRVFSVTGQENRFIGLTIAGGREFFDTGGNVIMGHGAALELDHVRITDGIAARGGGIATGGGGSLIVRHSLIDNNEARFTGQVPSSGDGGGLLMTSTDNPQTLEVSDTTIAFNRASRGAGVLAERQDGNETTLQRVTIADNAATGARGGGLTILDLEFVLIKDSIIARNTGNIGSAAVVIAPSNCSVILPSTGGGNVESGTDCGLERKNTTGGLATALADNGGQTPTLALPWTSDVHDFAGGCTGSDQRDVARPQGAGCDPGRTRPRRHRRLWWSRPTDADRHPDDGPATHPDGHSGADARDQPDGRRRARARHGPGEGARGEGVREARRHAGHPGRLDRGRAQGPRHAHVDPQAGRATGDRHVLRRDLQGHAVARDHQPDAGRGARPLPEAGPGKRGGQEEVAQAVG